jgi:hypothetical protein
MLQVTIARQLKPSTWSVSRLLRPSMSVSLERRLNRNDQHVAYTHARAISRAMAQWEEDIEAMSGGRARVSIVGATP